MFRGGLCSLRGLRTRASVPAVLASSPPRCVFALQQVRFVVSSGGSSTGSSVFSNPELLSRLADEALTPAHMQHVVGRLRTLHAPEEVQISMGREAFMLFRCVIRYNSWQVVNLPAGPLSFSAPGGHPGRILPLLTKPTGESFDTLAEFNPGVSTKTVTGRSFFSPGTLGLHAKAADAGSVEDASNKVVGVTIDPTKTQMLLYDQGLFPALFEAAIAVRVEDAVRALTEPSAALEDANQVLMDIAGDDVWFAEVNIDGVEGITFSAAFTPGEPGFEKATVAGLLHKASAACARVEWRFVTLADGKPAVWPPRFVTAAHQKLQAEKKEEKGPAPQYRSSKAKDEA